MGRRRGNLIKGEQGARAYSFTSQERFSHLDTLPVRGKCNPIVIDLAQVYEMAKIGCSVKEIAALLMVPTSFVEDRIHDTVEFSRAIDLGRTHLKKDLRRKQIEVAMTGEVRMLIWLGKQMLDQAEKAEIKTESKVNVLVQNAQDELAGITVEQLAEARRILSAPLIELETMQSGE